MKNKNKIGLCLILGICILGILVFFANQEKLSPESNTEVTDRTEMSDNTEVAEGLDTMSESEEINLIYSAGTTVSTRINAPKGFQRNECASGSFTEFLRNYSLKEDGSPVLLYNGENKRNQSAHVAVLKLPIEKEDLQQCADSVMRIYAEYYYATRQYDKIQFHFVNGFLAEYTKWREGYRVSFEGNQTSWVKTNKYDDSYENFKEFMRIVFAYASTLSIDKESVQISIEDLQIGDVFLKGGSPGHVVMVIDMCENAQGKKAFLLAQGYMPAQEFHILKNPLHEDDPWYYVDEIVYPFHTPEYTFHKGSLKRLNFNSL